MISREEAIDIIINQKIKELTCAEREDLLMEIWFEDEGDFFSTLPEKLQCEMKQSEQPISNVTDKKYDVLVINVLKCQFYGVTNEYLSKVVSKLLKRKVEVLGEVEKLYMCPCCGYLTLKQRGNYYICPVCLWEDSGDNDLYRASSVNNGMTLVAARTNFMKYGSMYADEKSKTDPDIKERYIKSSFK